MAYSYGQEKIIEKFEEFIDLINGKFEYKSLLPYDGDYKFTASEILQRDPVMYYQELLAYCDKFKIDFDNLPEDGEL